MNREQRFKEFMDQVIEPYLQRRPSEKGIDEAFGLLKQKVKLTTSVLQVDVIGDLSKEVTVHVPRSSKYYDYAWRKHLELDNEIKKAKDRLRTEVESSIGGKIGIRGFEFGAKKVKRRKLPRMI